MSLRQGCPHCARFLIAASRRSMDRVSVPWWLTALSRQLPVLALVSHYLTNKLIGRGPLLKRRSFTYKIKRIVRLSCIIPSFDELFMTLRQVIHALLTRLPLSQIENYQPKSQEIRKGSFDLHTLGTQPTFILSYDQTLIEKRLTYILHT